MHILHHNNGKTCVVLSLPGLCFKIWIGQIIHCLILLVQPKIKAKHRAEPTQRKKHGTALGETLSSFHVIRGFSDCVRPETREASSKGKVRDAREDSLEVSWLPFPCLPQKPELNLERGEFKRFGRRAGLRCGNHLWPSKICVGRLLFASQFLISLSLSLPSLSMLSATPSLFLLYLPPLPISKFWQSSL